MNSSTRSESLFVLIREDSWDTRYQDSESDNR